MKLKELKETIFTDLTIIDMKTNITYTNVNVWSEEFDALEDAEVIGIRTRIKEIGNCAYSYLEILVK
jgi:hypothetical protein